MSSDTPQVVCLHDFALPTPCQPPEQVKRYRSSTHVPVIFGSPVLLMAPPGAPSAVVPPAQQHVPVHACLVVGFIEGECPAAAGSGRSRMCTLPVAVS